MESATLPKVIIDFHAHAFPDALAERAVRHLSTEGNVQAFSDGTVSGLLASMGKVGIERAVVCSIATKPEQFAPILAWSKQIASSRIFPLASIHPLRDPDPLGKAQQVADAGLVGIKLHPYYQDFQLDDPALCPFYRKLEHLGLLVVVHTGFDFAFPRDRKCDPVRILRVLESVPQLRLVTTHLGAWDDWEEVEKHLIGKPIWMEISMSIERLGRERARGLLLSHPADRVLFGTDSPWTSQAETLALVKGLHLGEKRESAIFEGNARLLLGGG